MKPFKFIPMSATRIEKQKKAQPFKITVKIFLGILVIMLIPVFLFFLFAGAIKVHDFVVLKWFPLLSSFLGFYLAGKINNKTRLVFLPFLYLSLIIFLPFRYFYFPFIFLIVLFSTLGLLISRHEITRRYKTYILTISILLFGFYLFSQPFIIEQKGFGSDVNKNLYNATVLWDFSSGIPSSLPNELFEDEDGNEINLEEFGGKNIYITFWATWCGPCISEKPFLEELKEEYSDSLIFIDISVDKNKEHWRNYLNKNNPKGIQLITKNEYKTRSNFLFDGIPFNILVNKKGIYKECSRPSVLKERILSSSKEIDNYILKPREVRNDNARNDIAK